MAKWLDKKAAGGESLIYIQSEGVFAFASKDKVLLGRAVDLINKGTIPEDSKKSKGIRFGRMRFSPLGKLYSIAFSLKEPLAKNAIAILQTNFNLVPWRPGEIDVEDMINVLVEVSGFIDTPTSASISNTSPEVQKIVKGITEDIKWKTNVQVEKVDIKVDQKNELGLGIDLSMSLYTTTTGAAALSRYLPQIAQEHLKGSKVKIVPQKKQKLK
jgi:bacillopeptidase F (M6 metalloprotease family)